MPKAKKPEAEILEEVVEATEVADTSSREARWEEFLVKAKISNPVKFAQKEERGEFNKIPESFK